MDPSFLFFLRSSSSEESERGERVARRILRDKSDIFSLTPQAFVRRFRLSKEAFMYVLLELNLPCQHSTAVPPELQLGITLLLLGSGSYQHAAGSDYLMGLAQSTVSKFVNIVLKEMEQKLCPKHIKFDVTGSRECKASFVEKFGIPGVIGCVDGTHIGLQKPNEHEHMFFNRKGFHSLNALVICDHEYKINAINSKYGGAAHDSFIWRHSDERSSLEEKFMQRNQQNCWLLGDSGYPLEPWCITPYRNPTQGSREANFNEIHSKARCIIERTIGILNSRWRVLQNNKRTRYSPEKVAMIVNVCAALHNICILYKIPFEILPNVTRDIPFIEQDEDSHLYRAGYRVRDQICSILSH